MLHDAGVAIAHVDIADGVHSPLFTFGPLIVEAIGTRLLRDVHLLVKEPLDHIEAVSDAGADAITFQLEGCRDPHRTLQLLSEVRARRPSDRPLVCGVGIGMGTPVGTLEPLLALFDHVLVLAIEPGRPRQAWPEELEARVEDVRRLVTRAHRPVTIGLDGGVTRSNTARAATMPLHVIVAGSAIFGDGDPAGTIRRIHEEFGQMRLDRSRPRTIT